MTKLITSILMITWLLMASPAIHAQCCAPASITGSVVDGDEHPIAGVSIVLSRVKDLWPGITPANFTSWRILTARLARAPRDG